jgi:hypothetical protein
MEIQMSRMTPFLFGAVVGAIAIAILGFQAFGWKLDSQAQTMAQEATDAAMKEALVPVCVAQFRADPEASSHLATLKTMDYSSPRSDYMHRGGWATLPGHKEPTAGIANACANALIAEKQQAQQSQQTR